MAARLRRLVALLAAAPLAACGVGQQSALPEAGDMAATFEGPVARAQCGPGSVEESGLQGQVTKEDRASGRSLEGYRCNLEQVGAYAGDGASWQFAWYEDCGYYDTSDGANVARDADKRGTVTVDVSDPSAPRPTAFLNTLAMRDPWESLKASEVRGLLAAVHQNGPELDVYDIAEDCTAPKLVFSYPMKTAEGVEAVGHAGDWSRDGSLYYGAELSESPYAYDMTRPDKPVIIAEPADFPGAGTHDLSTNDEGTRLYVAQVDDQPGNGLVILDVSQVKARKRHPDITQVGTLVWTDGKNAQQTMHVVIGGMPFILFTDEGGGGAARLIDIRDETNPVVAAKLKLEVHMPENAQAVQGDTTNGAKFGYEAHYCGVDDPHDTTTVACSYFQSGIRVFDVRDPYRPREIAYFYPPLPALGSPVLGSQNSASTNAPYCTAQVRLVPERGELWTTCQDNGFMVLKFTNGAWPFKN